MAFVYDPNEEEEEKKTQGQGAEQVISSSGGGFIPQGAQPSGQGGALGGEQRSSGNWTNLQNYISANKGNDGQLAQGIQAKVGSQAQEYEGKATAYDQGAREAISKNTVSTDGNVLSALKNAPKNVDKGAFQTQYNANYAGPQSAADYDSNTYTAVGQQAKQVSQKVNASETEQGKRALIEESYARPSYTGGEKNLDMFVLGSGEAGAQGLQKLRTDYGGLEGKWGSLTAQLNSQAQTAKATTDATRQAARDTYSQAVGGVESQLAATKVELDKKNAGYDAASNAIETQLRSSDPLERARGYAALGITVPEAAKWASERGFSPLTQAYTKGTRLSIGDVADPGAVDTYGALLGLTDAASQFDLQKAGGVDKAFNVNTEKVSGVNAAYTKQAELKQRVAAAQAATNDQNTLHSMIGQISALKRKSEWMDAEKVKQQAAPILAKYGVNLKDYPLLDLDDLASMIPKQRAVQVGDVMSDEERGSWSNLMSTLGIQSNLDITNHGGQAPAMKFDKAALKKLNDARAAQWTKGLGEAHSGGTEKQVSAQPQPQLNRNAAGSSGEAGRYSDERTKSDIEDFDVQKMFKTFRRKK